LAAAGDVPIHHVIMASGTASAIDQVSRPFPAFPFSQRQAIRKARQGRAAGVDRESG